jgi:hypothetical protein
MRWVVAGFYAALTVGLLAMLSALFVTPLGELIFSCVLAVFYTCFATGFINYAFRFGTIEAALENDDPPASPAETSARMRTNLLSERKFSSSPSGDLPPHGEGI